MARKHHKKEVDKNMALSAIGVILVILGILGLFAVESVASAFFIAMGIILSVSGVALIVAGISLKGQNSEFPAIGMGILYLIVGLLLAIFPSSVVAFLALMLGIYFIIAGIAKIVGWYKEESNRAAMILFGIIDFLFGSLILVGWPNHSDVLMGILISIELIFMGMALMKQ